MKDKYGREIDYLRISLTDKCNLRCAYCMEKDHNDFIQNDKLMTLDEILRVVKECASIGIKKVSVTFKSSKNAYKQNTRDRRDLFNH